MQRTRATGLYLLIAALSLAALAMRFDEVARVVPQGAQLGALAAVVALMVVGAHFAGLVRPESTVELPLWMRLPGAARAAFGLGFTVIAVVALQTWNLSIGPINPAPPASWPLATRAQFFGMMTVGMFFPNYLAATGVVVPGMMTLVKPFQKWGAGGAVASAVIGVILGALAAGVIASQPVGAAVQWGQHAWSAADAAVGGAVTLGMILLPVAYGIVSGD